MRSGGFSDRYGQADNHVVIDMNHLTSIDIDVQNKVNEEVIFYKFQRKNILHDKL